MSARLASTAAGNAFLQPLDFHVQPAELYERIGRLNMEVEWLKKSVARGG